jgi:hypothetical protein
MTCSILLVRGADVTGVAGYRRSFGRLCLEGPAPSLPPMIDTPGPLPGRQGRLHGHREVRHREWTPALRAAGLEQRTALAARTATGNSLASDELLIAANVATIPAVARPTMFVVLQVRQTLQQAGAMGAYSAARLVTGAALTRSCPSNSALLAVWATTGRRLRLIWLCG